jgi:CYTH domain-containing protein
MFDANEIRKNRYKFLYEGREFAIDMFLGDLFGLMLAEVGFETDEELDNFAKPAFAVADVTNHQLFTGGSLSQTSFDDIRKAIVKDGKLNLARASG